MGEISKRKEARKWEITDLKKYISNIHLYWENEIIRKGERKH